MKIKAVVFGTVLNLLILSLGLFIYFRFFTDFSFEIYFYFNFALAFSTVYLFLKKFFYSSFVEAFQKSVFIGVISLIIFLAGYYFLVL